MLRLVAHLLNIGRLRIEFPAGYPISVPPSGGFCVYAGATEHHDEKARLQVMKCFSVQHDQENDRYALELTACPAVMGLCYELCWVPPYAHSVSRSL